MIRALKRWLRSRKPDPRSASHVKAAATRKANRRLNDPILREARERA